MKITPALRKEINQAVRDNVRYAAPLAEVGFRGKGWGSNALLWTEDDDLGDLTRLALVKEFTDDPDNPGCVELDLYVTTGSRHNRQLETNVCVLIRDGHVVGATSESREIDDLKARLNFPKGKGW
jgi:hypothetical protein